MKKLNFISIVTFAFLLFSCDDANDKADFDQELLRVNSIAEFSSELDFSLANDLALQNQSFSGRNIENISTVPDCATITVNNTTPGVFPKIITVDFGTGCTHNGITRSGILTLTLSNYLTQNGSILTIERDNYYVNSNKIEGTIVYENQTTNLDMPQWTRTLTNGVITLPSGLVYTHSGTRVVQQIEGATTIVLADNVFKVLSGTHTVNRPNGSTLTATIVNPLIKKYSCNYISQGSASLVGTYLNGIIDYGNNECDNIATYTHSNGTIFTINL